MKYFVVSDIHSFYIELKSALKRAGFNKRNKNHVLIVCGDVFDRGPCTVEVYKYLMSIPKKRRIMVRGNHEDLYEELLKKQFPDDYDYSNHTVDTFCHIAGYNPEIMTPKYWYRLGDTHTRDRMRQAWQEIRSLVREHPITKWIQSSEWLNYYELGKYIFVHSFIPVNNEDSLPGYYIHNRAFTEFENWRELATEQDWYDARWGCPWRNYTRGLFEQEEKNGKVLVCGHWVVTDFRENLDCDFSGNTGVYFSDHLIGLDCGCWHYRGTSGYYHPTNVLVIDGDKCYDQHGTELTYYKSTSHRIIETVYEGDLDFNENDL